MRTPLALYALALVARFAIVVGFPDPAYPDSFYYVDVARQLAAGHGLTIDLVWVFAEVGGAIPAIPVLPIPSNAHWMPLASLVQVPFTWALGPTALASALPFALFGALAAPLAWAIARDAGASPVVAVGAGVLTAIPALTFPFMAQPDNFSLYQPLVAASLWLTARGLRGHPRSFVAAGLLAGVATLSRTDGVLVLAVIVAAASWDRLRGRLGLRFGEVRPARVPLLATLGAVTLFATAIVPWWLRQLSVFGTLSPSTASGKVLFIRDIGEWNSIATPATLDHLLGMGLGPLLATRLNGLLSAIEIFTILVGAVVLVPLMAAGGWARRRDTAFGPFFGYAALLFTFSTLVSAVHVPGGTFIHSAVALVPHAYVLALEGVAVAVGWLGRRRPAWRNGSGVTTLTGGIVAFTVLAGMASVGPVHDGWSRKRDQMQAASVALDQAGIPAGERLMSIDASGYRYWTGHPGVVLVNDPVGTVEQVARAYGIRWLVLEGDDIVPTAHAILVDGVRPAWVGPPILDTDAVSVYPVCTTPGDERCPATGGGA